MTRYERISAMLFSAISVFAVYYGVNVLKLGTVEEPGPGFFPALCGAGILILCLIWVLTAPRSAQHQSLWQGREWVTPLVSVIIITAYAALMEEIGYVTSTLAFLVAWQVFIARETWVRTGLIAVLGTAAMYLIFAKLLSVPLPDGLLL